MIMALIIVVIPYLIGSIPFYSLLPRLLRYIAIRTTYTLFIDNRRLELLTLLLDFIKGYLPLYIIIPLGYGQTFATCGAALTETVIGIFIILGQVLPVWLNFKGGKGVVTATGVITALNPLLGVCLVLLWLVAFTVSKCYSLSSLTAFAGTTLLALTSLSTITVGDCNIGYFYFSMMLIINGIIFTTHRSNITNLLKGTEPKWNKAYFFSEL